MSVTVKYFSGYIRNYKKLCDELEIALPLSRPEREEKIIAKAFEKWGTAVTDHLYGFFAFTVSDGEKTYVFRDQVGQKQMFYAVLDGELVASGDINEIAADKRYSKKLNRRMLQQYLFYGYPIGEETFYEGIMKLCPGHYLEWDGKTLGVHRYFKPEFKPEHDKTAEYWAEEIEKVVDEILGEERADEEVPYKESFLSGGVDSSYLLAAGDAVAANTVGYAEPGFDESDQARHTAEILGKGFNVKTIEPAEYFARIPHVMDNMGQPLGDASAVAFSLGCQAVRSHAQVVYSGEGIDEFFGGYNMHKRPLGEGWTYLTCSHIMNEESVRELLNEYDESVSPFDPVTPLWKETEGQDELSRKLYVDISLWLEGDIYLNTDRTSTACSVELHTPFSDLRLFNIASRIPAEMKFREEQNKYAFRLAASGKLPKEIAFRKKVGFPVPIRKWMADPHYNKPVEEALMSETSRKFFKEDVINDLWSRYIGGEALLWSKLYAIYAFIIWYDMKFEVRGKSE